MNFARSGLRRLLLLCLALPFAADAAEKPKRVLVVTVTTGFRHSSIPVAEKVLQELATRSGKFTVEFVRQPEGMPQRPRRPSPGAKGADDPAHQKALLAYAEADKAFQAAYAAWLPKAAAALAPLSPANLKAYDAVLFASTSGDDLPLPDRQGLIDWVAGGKAFIGVHAASDTLKVFAPYVSMIGGAFRTHGPQVTVECVNQDPAHAACASLPARWTVFDEIYEFRDYQEPRVHNLLSLEKHPQQDERGHFPLSWARKQGQGRVFYTALGHREDVWDPTYTKERKNPPEVAQKFQEHLLGGILWALGLAPGDVKHAP